MKSRSRRGAGRNPTGQAAITAPPDKAGHDRMVALVDRMLGLHRRLAAAKRDDDRTCLHRLINATDRKIDNLVYELYALTPDEIRIVEEATNA